MATVKVSVTMPDGSKREWLTDDDGSHRSYELSVRYALLFKAAHWYLLGHGDEELREFFREFSDDERTRKLAASEDK